MNFKDQILSRTGTPETGSTDAEISYYLNSTIKDVINKVKSVNPDAYSRLATETEVGSEGTTIIDGDIVGVYGSSVHEGTGVSSVTITVTGSGYTDGDPATNVTVAITGGGGSGATAYAVVSGGVISDLILTASGSGYTSTPIVAITTTDSGSAGAAIAVLNSSVTYRRPAAEIPFELSQQAKNPVSIHYQSKFNPVWSRTGRSISIIPDGGIILHIDIPVTSYDSENILNVPKTFENAIVIGSAIKHSERYLQYFTQNSIPSLGETAIPAPPSFSEVLPDDLIAPTFTWTSISLQSKFDGQSIDTTNISSNFPTYVIPALEIPTLTAMNDLVLPDPPSVPGFITQEISMSDVPTFSAPAFQIEEFPTIIEFNPSSVLPDAPIPPTLSAEIIAETSLEALPSPPIYVVPLLLGQAKSMLEDSIGSSVDIGEGDAQNINTLIEAAWSYVAEEEDVELANATLSVLTNIQSLYGTSMSEADKEYQARVAEYSSVITRQMEKARLEQTSSHKQNDADWQAQMAQYEKQLAHHGAEMSRYQADLQAQQSEWQLKNITYAMGKWSQKQDKYFAEFDKSMQGSMNQFTNDMASWDKEFQDKTKGLEYIAQGQAAAIGNFDKNMAKYAADVKLLADEYQQNEILRKWEKYKFDYTQSLSKFSAEMQSNLHTFNEQNTRLTAELTIAQTNANNIQSALMGQMSADTELSKNNEAQRLAMDLQTFQQDLTAFNANMSKYQNEVGTIAGRYNVEMSAATSNMTNNQNIFNADLQVFQNKQQALEKLLGGLRQEYAESIGVIIKPKQGE